MFTISKKWTDEEIQFLKFAYTDKEFTIAEISNSLNRSVTAIRNKAYYLNLKRYKEELGEGLKRCSRCKTIFTFESFHKNGKNRIHSQCKECKNATLNKKMNLTKNVSVTKEVNLAKKCSKCKEFKNLSEFGKNRSTHDGYSRYCKECSKISKDESNLRLLKERGW